MAKKKFSVGFTLPTNRLPDRATSNLFQEVEKQSIRIANNINTLETLLEATRKEYVQTVNLTKILLDYGLKNGLVQKQLNADMLDGYHVGDGVDEIPALDAQVLTKLLRVDGAGSGLDADLLDGYNTGNGASDIPALDADLLTKLKRVGAYITQDGQTPLTADWDAGSYKVKAETFESDVATGTAPLVVASTTLVANLNVQRFNSQLAAYYAVRATETLYREPMRMYKNGDQLNIAQYTWTQITGWTEDFDESDDSYLDAANNRITVPAGVWEFNLFARIQLGAAATVYVGLYCEDSTKNQYTPNTFPAGLQGLGGSFQVKITTTRSFTMYMYFTSQKANNDVESGSPGTWFSCKRIG